jgi:hypothetical protein
MNLLQFRLWLFWCELSTNPFLLKINRVLFWWYYKRVPEFYHQWTMLHSLRLLNENYKQAQDLLEMEVRIGARYAEDAALARRELYQIRMQQAGPNLAAAASKMFGMDYTPPETN